MKTLLLTVLTFFCLSLCSSTYAAVDMFIKIPDIDGEAEDNDHRGEIDVLAWSWGTAFANRLAEIKNHGKKTKKVEVNEFTFTKKTDTATPHLYEACTKGTYFEKVFLTVKNADGTRADEYTITLTMTGVVISSIYTDQMDTQQDVPTENVTLNFTKVEFEYTRVNPDGSKDVIKAGYDISVGKKI